MAYSYIIGKGQKDLESELLQKIQFLWDCLSNFIDWNFSI